VNKRIDLSIVIPVYNSADIFPELYRRLVASLERAVNSFEIIAVLDGCKDKSFEVISRYCLLDKRVKLIEFSRNFGHQAAISAGLFASTGEMVAVMDDDLEDPPEVLLQFIEKMREGFDVVYGIRKKRKRSVVYRYLYLLFYRFLGRIADLKMPYDAGDFCIMRGCVVKVLNDMPERNRYLRGLRAWSGFEQTGIEYDREERFSSISGYSFKKYVALALDAIFSFSYKPLKFVSVIGMMIALISFIVGVRLIFLKLTGQISDVPGWASLAVSILFLTGIQLVSIGIIGEYIARIYDEVKQRPKYIVRRSIGLEGEEDHAGSGK
jgi:glycosyltransferase involved in cell wall biosynthesis